MDRRDFLRGSTGAVGVLFLPHPRRRPKDYVRTVTDDLMTRDYAYTVGFTGVAATAVLTNPIGASDAISWLAGAPAAWYVSPSGSDSNSGTSAGSPFLSINRAYQAAAAGDTIAMAAGFYPGNQTIAYRPVAAAWGQNVVVQPQGGAVTIGGNLSVQSPHLTVRDIAIVGFAQMLSNSGGSANYGRFESIDSAANCVVTGADNCAVINSRLLSGIDGVALVISPYNPGDHRPTNTLIENCEIGPSWLSTGGQAAGVHNESCHVMGAIDLTIRKCLIWEGGSSSSLQIDTSLGGLTDILIEKNYIAGCGLRTPPGGAVCAAFYAVGLSNWSGLPTPEITFRENTVRGGLVDYISANGGPGVGAAILEDNVIDAGVLLNTYSTGNIVGSGSWGNTGANTIATPIYTSPSFGGLAWGMAAGSPGVGKGVPVGEGYTP